MAQILHGAWTRLDKRHLVCLPHHFQRFPNSTAKSLEATLYAEMEKGTIENEWVKRQDKFKVAHQLVT